MISRRDLLVAGGLGAAPAIGTTQQLAPVRLMVVRRMGVSPANQCVAPCIRGSLYDVSDMSSALDDTLLPLLKARKPVCDIIERPWKDNKPNVSAIPKGVYAAAVRTDKTKSWMSNENRVWRLELAGTPKRSAIQFHYGQDVDWSEGCFIVGSLLQPGDASGVTARYCAVDHGEAAVSALRAVVTAAGRDPRKISVGVADDSGLFAGLQPKEPC